LDKSLNVHLELAGTLSASQAGDSGPQVHLWFPTQLPSWQEGWEWACRQWEEATALSLAAEEAQSELQWARLSLQVGPQVARSLDAEAGQVLEMVIVSQKGDRLDHR